MRTFSLLLFGLLIATRAPAQDRLAVVTEPGTPVVATEFLLTVGPLDEDEGEEGITYLAGRAVIDPIRAALDSLGARVSVMPEKDAIAFSIVAAPDAWEQATALVGRALFRDPPEGAAVRREQVAIVNELNGRSANPADAATRESDAEFFGRRHPWGRPIVGTPRSVSSLRFDDVEGYLRANFTPDRAVAAVVGPVDSRDVARHLNVLLGSSVAERDEPEGYRPSDDIEHIDYNSITTWITASFPFEPDDDVEAIRMFAYLVADALSFSPLQRSVFNVTSAVEVRRAGGEVRLQLVVPPEEADDWADRILEVVDDLEERPLLDDVFRGHLRRYRGVRLMTLIGPEERAHAAARELVLRGRFDSVIPDLGGLTQERVRSAGRALGDPAIVLLGPNLEN